MSNFRHCVNQDCLFFANASENLGDNLHFIFVPDFQVVMTPKNHISGKKCLFTELSSWGKNMYLEKKKCLGFNYSFVFSH